MKIAIFGSNGMLGRYVTSYLSKQACYSVTTFTRKEFDILKSDFSHESMPNVSQFDYIINCAGIVKSLCDKYTDSEIYKVNSIFPKILAERSKNLIHISTDCVFLGKTNSENYENSASLIYPLDLYGRSKLLGEPSESIKALTIRTSIIGEESRGDSFIEFVKKNNGKEINGYVNHYWNGVTCLELAKFIDSCIDIAAFDHNGEVKFPSNIIHFYSPEIVNKYELCQLVAHVYDLNIKINQHKTKDCYRNLKSLYTISQKYCTTDILSQIKEQKEWGEKYFK